MKVALSLSASVFLAIGGFSHLVGAAAQDREVRSGSTATVVACVMRETDYVRAAAPAQLLLTDVESGALTYVVTGVREAELTPHVGGRVQITGVIERARTTPLLATAEGSRTGSVKSEAPAAAGVTPDGAAAHEPSDALSATVQAAPVLGPAGVPSDPAYRIATLPRLNIASVRPVAGACSKPPETRQPAAVLAADQAPARAPSAAPTRVPPAPEQITARGCLVRQTPEGGTALTPQSDSRDRFALTKAFVIDSLRAPGGGVPGSQSSGSGSGTVPDRPVPVGTSGSNGMGTLTFALAPVSGDLRQLTSSVGERVEVRGTAAAPAADPRNGQTAHPSAPTQLITVTSVRVIGGRCD